MKTLIEAQAQRALAVDGSTAQRAEKKAGGRSLDIDRAKGFGIALVVWGHIATASTPDSPLWFYVSVAVIYTFHMPFFMYLSGFIFFMIGGQERFWSAPAKQVAKRFDRLMVPFLAFGTLVVIGKYFAEALGPVDDQVGSVGAGLMKVVTNAPDNPSMSVWYLFVLFTYSVAAPLLWRLSGRNLLVILLAGAAGWLLPLPDAYYLKRIGIYFIFFGVGGFVALNRERVLPLFAKWCAPALLAFGTACYLLLGSPLALLVCGLLSIPALHGFFLQKPWERDSLMLMLGRYSMAIYLLNTIAIGATKLIYLRFLPYEGPWFLPFVGLVFAAGLIGPMLARRTMGAIPPLLPLKRYLD